MDATVKRLIGENTCSMYKQACENADLLNDADMIAFVREDVADGISYVSRKTGADVSILMAAVNAAATIPAIFAALDAAGCSPVQWCDTYGYSLAA